MKTVADILRSVPVWLNPTHRLETALLLMRAYDLEGLPVLDGEHLAGMVLCRQALGREGSASVSEVMDDQVSAIAPSLSVREAAEVMLRDKRGVLPVLGEDGVLMGVLSDGDLLAELRLATDPITELPWSDSLREWAVEQLQAGREITLLFIDIDDFGAFNKQHGHIVGDAVLRSVADTLRVFTDRARDMVCRYGGDEFCIASLRTSAEATVLSENIAATIQRLQIPEVQGKGIRATFGACGGKRTREREHIHYVATLNNLINLASTECMARKAYDRLGAGQASGEPQAMVNLPALSLPLASAVPEVVTQANGDSAPPSLASLLRQIQLDEVQVVRSNSLYNVRVRLTEQTAALLGDGGQVDAREAAIHNAGTACVTYSSDITRTTSQGSLAQIIAEATVSALRRALPAGYEVRVTEVLERSTAEDKKLVTVIGSVAFPTGSSAFAGTAFSDADPNHAPALALLNGLGLER